MPNQSDLNAQRPDPPRRRATATDRGLAHALRLFGTKRVMPERVILQKRLAASNAAGRLIHCFDRISGDGLDRLVTVQATVSPGLRFEEGLCLLKAVPFRDCHALGWGWSVQADDLSASVRQGRTSSRECPNKMSTRVSGSLRCVRRNIIGTINHL